MKTLANVFKSNLLITLFLLSTFTFSEVFSQPTAYNNNGGTSGTTYVFGSSTAKKNQTLILPADWATATVQGYMDTLYFMYHTAGTSNTLTNLVISIGQTAETAFPGGTTFFTDLAEVLNVPSYTIPAGVAGDWIRIPLPTKLIFDPSKTLIVEVKFDVSSSTSYSCRYGSSKSGRRLYANSTTATTGTTSSLYPNVGLFLTEFNMSYSSSIATQNNTTNVIAGFGNQELLGLKVTMDGSLNPLNVTSFVLNTNGTTNPSDISNAKLFYTGASTVFATTNQFGTTFNSPSGSFTINGTQQLLPGDNYFWLTYDLPLGATEYNVVDAECNSITVGGASYTPAVTAPVGNRTIRTPLYGTKTIGSGGDYPTFTAAVEHLNVVGPGPGGVTFNVNGGETFNESPVRITATGSAGNPIIFQTSIPGTNALLRVAGTPSAKDAGIRILSGDYFTFNGIDVENAGTSDLDYLEIGYHLVDSTGVDGCCYNNVKNCNVTLDTVITGSTGIWIEADLAASNSGTNNYNKFYNNTIQLVRIGYRPDGKNSTYYDYGNEIGTEGDGKSIITNIGGPGVVYGINATWQKDFKIFNTKMTTFRASGIIHGIYSGSGHTGDYYNNEMSDFISNSSIYPINLVGAEKLNIYNNKIYNIASDTKASSGYVRGIDLAGDTVNVFNNMIYDIRNPENTVTSATSCGTAGIYAATTAAGQNRIYNNTVMLNFVSASTENRSGAIFIGNTSPGSIDMRNNIFINLTDVSTYGTRAAVILKGGTSLTNIASTTNNNVYYAGTPSEKNVIFSNGTNHLQTLSDYKSWVAPRDNRSISVMPPFISAVDPYDLHIDTTALTQLESGGILTNDIITINYDIDGDLRFGAPGYAGTGDAPDIGADEFEGIGVDLAGPAILYTTFTRGPLGTSMALNGVQITDKSNVNITPGTRPRLYYKKSDDANTYAGNTSSDNGWKWVEAAGTGGSPFNFTFDYSLLYNSGGGSGSVALDDTIQYFVVAQDMSDSINVGINTGNFAIKPASVNLSAEAFPLTGTINSYVIKTPFTGSYSLSSTESFPTLGDFFAALNGGVVTGNVTANVVGDLVESATASLNQFFEYPPNSDFTLTIQPVGQREISGTVTGALIKLTGADRVTIDGLNTGGNSLKLVNKIEATSTSVIWISSQGTNLGATWNTIKNCNIVGGSKYLTSSFGIYVAGTTVSTSGTGADNHNITIQNNTIKKAYYGIYAAGTTTRRMQNLLISSNVIGSEDTTEHVTYRGIMVTGADAALITQNRIFNMSIGTGVTIAAIDLGTTTSGSVVSRNLIYGMRQPNTSGYGVHGIVVSSNTTSDGISIINNVIYDLINDGDGLNTSTNPNGIRITGGKNHKVYYNSVNLFGSFLNPTTNDLSAALVISATAVTGTDIRNNILANSITGGSGSKCYAIYGISGVTYGTINHNDYYVSGPNGVLGYNGGDITTLANWRLATGQDVNSLDVNPLFNSPTILKPTFGSPVIAAGVAIPEVAIDFEGVIRGTPPSIGAYENAGDAAVPVITYTPLPNTTSTANRTMSNVVVTDFSGVNITLGLRPRIYYKKSTHDNTFIDNTSATNGWKYSEATGTGGSPFSFVVDYTRLYGGSVSAGDFIQYFIVAQDLASTPNVGISTGNFASQPASVDLTAAAFPVTGDVKSYSIAIAFSGAYNVGTGQTYLTLTGSGGFFEALNSNVITGDVTISIVSDLAEDGAVALNQLAEEGAGGYTVKFQSDGSIERLIYGSVLNGMIKLNGADRIVFDGRRGVAGRFLRFRNTHTSSPTFTFINDATNNTIRNCFIEGATTSTTNGVIFFSTGLVTGNDNNLITENIIRDLSSGTNIPANLIFSKGSVIGEGDENIQPPRNMTIENKINATTEENSEITESSGLLEYSGYNTEIANSNNTISNNEIFNFTTAGINITNFGNGPNWVISGNSIYYNNPNLPNASQSGISFLAGSGNNNISGNFIGGTEANAGGDAWTNTGTGTITGIDLAVERGAGVVSQVQNNKIGNITGTNTLSIKFYGINITNGDVVIDGNIIGDTSSIKGVKIYGNSTTHGINSQSRNGNVTITNNLVANLSAEGTVAGSRVRGIAVPSDSTGIIIISGNTICNLSTKGAGTGIAGASPVAMGIYHFPTGYGTGTDIYGNTIYSISCENQDAISNNVVAGMVLTNILGRIANNTIYDIKNLSTGSDIAAPPIAAGIYIRFAAGNLPVYNNMISVGSDQNTNTQFNGIWNASGDATNSFRLYYNSINISGNVSSGDIPTFGFLRGDNTGVTAPSRVTLRNNILNNVRSGGTGKHYAIANQNASADTTGWAPGASNYNLLNNVNNLNLTLWGTSDLKIEQWQSIAGCDLNSKTGDPLYLSALDLHITNEASPANNSGIVISGIVDDIDGDLRSTYLPDIGADEFGTQQISLAVNYNSNWNMLSNPVIRSTGTDSVKQLYPSSLFSYAFSFIPGTGYTQKNVFENGVGYWLKFADAGTADIMGLPLVTDTVDVAAGWNMVGSISSTIDTSTITSIPSGIKASHWFGYNNGYSPAAQIIPGKAYWIKANSAGKFIFTSGSVLGKPSSDISMLDKFNTITITDKAGNSQTLYFGTDYEGINTDMYEMPPLPPSDAFDSRFENMESGYLLQTHDSELLESVSFPITIQSTAYPLIVSWKINSDTYSYELNYGDVQSKQTMTNEGRMTINNPDVTRLTLLAKSGGEVPAEFALMQNYPNPFNPVTNIKFALPIASKVTMEVFNILGQKVRTLIDEERAAGYHVIEWNSKNDSEQFTGSGVYYVKISADGGSGNTFTQVRKMVLLR